MRPRVPWMNEVDDSILEFFEDLEVNKGIRVPLPPTAVWYNLVEELGVVNRSADTISRRMNTLAEQGLLEKVDENRGYYRITDKGLDYLHGDLDATELEG